jgi:DNA-binding GntR family transcriptional regulator
VPVPSYSATTPRYVQIADDLRGKITAGAYAPGSKLPSNKDLTEQYGVADGTIRAALEELRGEGVIETQSTLGTFVTSKPGSSAPARLDLKAAGERLAELQREVQELRSRIGRMEAIVLNLTSRNGLPNPFEGSHDGTEKAPRRGRAGR